MTPGTNGDIPGNGLKRIRCRQRDRFGQVAEGDGHRIRRVMPLVARHIETENIGNGADDRDACERSGLVVGPVHIDAGSGAAGTPDAESEMGDDIDVARDHGPIGEGAVRQGRAGTFGIEIVLKHDRRGGLKRKTGETACQEKCSEFQYAANEGNQSLNDNTTK